MGAHTFACGSSLTQDAVYPGCRLSLVSGNPHVIINIISIIIIITIITIATIITSITTICLLYTSDAADE